MRSEFNILFVGTLPPHQGGSAIANAELLRSFPRYGCSVRAIAPMSLQTANGKDAFAEAHAELAVTRFPVPFYYVDPYFVPPEDYVRAERAGIELELTAAITQSRPDIIICGRETVASEVLPIVRRCHVPCVIRIAGGHISGISAGAQTSTAQRDLAQVMNGMAGVVTEATHMQNELTRWGVLHTRVIVNPVDLSRFAPGARNVRLRRELRIDDQAVVVFHASNMKACKRPVDIVRSAEQVLRTAPNVVYVIAGDGPLLPELERACFELGVRDSFRFTGWVAYESMPEYFAAADIVVMPSSNEQQARLYLEAQACGRTLLASDIPGAREVIDDGKTGVLFRMGDVADLTRKTLSVIACRELRQQIEMQARRYVARHELGRIAQEWISYLREIAQNFN